MKTLSKIQLVAKIGKIISKIIFICCIIGIVGCVIALVTVASVSDVIIDNERIGDLIVRETGKDINTLYFGISVSIISLIGELVLSKDAVKAFSNELKRGTPFTFEGAKEMFKLGLMTIIVVLAVNILSAIYFGIMKNFWVNIESDELTNEVSFGLGIMFMIVSLLCKYGAENQGKKSDKE